MLLQRLVQNCWSSLAIERRIRWKVFKASVMNHRFGLHILKEFFKHKRATKTNKPPPPFKSPNCLCPVFCQSGRVQRSLWFIPATRLQLGLSEKTRKDAPPRPEDTVPCTWNAIQVFWKAKTKVETNKDGASSYSGAIVCGTRSSFYRTARDGEQQVAPANICR